MPWHLVTEPDERERCCVVVDGERSPQPTCARIGDGSWDGYTYTCGDHVALVAGAEPGCVVEPVGP